MKQPHIIFKVAAVTSSVLLVSGLIAYKVGAFDSLFKNDEAASIDDETTYEKLFHGSKSAEVFPAPPVVQQKATEPITQPNPALMAGSKSAPTFLPGSKSPGLILPPKQGTTPAPVPSAPVTPPANSLPQPK